MIAVSSSSRSFASLGKYLVVGRDKVEEGRVAWTSSRNLPTDDPELAAKIMRATASQNVRVSQPVYHLALSFDPHDVVDRAIMERIADRLLNELKLDRHQTLIVAHADRAHPHMHILVNRVHPETGLVWDRWQDQPAIQRVLREQEREFGLRPVESSLDISRGPGTGRDAASSFSNLTAAFDAHERLTQATHEQFSAEREVAAGEARMARLEAALSREQRASEGFDKALARAYKEPERARDTFLSVAEEFGDREAARRMRESPEKFGELIAREERQWRFRHTEPPLDSAREAAREAAGYGSTLAAARRDLAQAIGVGQTAAPGSLRVDVDAPTVRAIIHAQIRTAAERLQSLRSAARTMGTHSQIEHGLTRGLRRLSPPEFERLCSLLSPERLSLAHKLRHVVRDAVLGRDET